MNTDETSPIQPDPVDPSQMQPGLVENQPGPVTDPDRIVSIDVLRGLAVLGILAMNIQSFAMPAAAYMNPTALGEPSLADWWIWVVGHVFTDRKFMTIFSMLFGAGILLMTSRSEAATGRSAGRHYLRMAILLIFGLMHAHLLWYGDILYTYAMCGFVVYLFRRKRPATLLIVGLIAVALPSAISLLFQWSMPYWPPENLTEMNKFWAPSAEIIAKEIATYRGSWFEQLPHRMRLAVSFQTFLFLIEFGWRSGGLMLVGMGLFKLDVFSARRSRRCYISMIAAAVFVGIPVILYGAHRNTKAGWTLESSFFLGQQFNYWASILVSLGWVGLIMLLCKSGSAPRLRHRLAATGRMALTNYFMQTIICTTIFYGHGLGIFGKVGRPGQVCVVLGVWTVLLIISPIWLGRFRFGPAEWLWRSLTYRKAQPMRLSA